MTTLELAEGGFSPIIFTFTREGLKAKAWNLLQAGHVKDVVEHRGKDRDSITIVGKVFRQMNVTASAYYVTLTLNLEREVIDDDVAARAESPESASTRWP